jgi:hypothetical protein
MKRSGMQLVGSETNAHLDMTLRYAHLAPEHKAQPVAVLVQYYIQAYEYRAAIFEDHTTSPKHPTIKGLTRGQKKIYISD